MSFPWEATSEAQRATNRRRVTASKGTRFGRTGHGSIVGRGRKLGTSIKVAEPRAYTIDGKPIYS